MALKVLWVCCRAQAMELAVNPSEFGRAMAQPGVLHRAGLALIEALAAHLPPEQRDGLSTIQQS